MSVNNLPLRSALAQFAQIMEAKLLSREARYGRGPDQKYLTVDPQALLVHAERELNELMASYSIYLAAENDAQRLEEGRRVIEECADLANMAMMMSDRMRRMLVVK